MTERSGLNRDDIFSLGFARDDGLVGDGFVGIAGESGCNGKSVSLHAQPRPPVVSSSLRRELQAEVAVLDVGPVTLKTFTPIFNTDFRNHPSVSVKDLAGGDLRAPIQSRCIVRARSGSNARFRSHDSVARSRRCIKVSNVSVEGFEQDSEVGYPIVVKVELVTRNTIVSDYDVRVPVECSFSDGFDSHSLPPSYPEKYHLEKIARTATN